MTRIFDMFCSNGSTYVDKDYFLNQVYKNDIRKGKYKIEHQTIDIKTNSNIDAFKPNYYFHQYENAFNLVYLDPPHLKHTAKGIMVKKYGKLNEHWKKDFKQMFENASLLARIVILKWNDVDIDLNQVLELAKDRFFITIANKRKTKGNINNTYFVVLIKKD